LPNKVSYLRKFGVERLPTVVLFRNGRPLRYDGEFSNEYPLIEWLESTCAQPAEAREEEFDRGAHEAGVARQMKEQEDARNQMLEKERHLREQNAKANRLREQEIARQAQEKERQQAQQQADDNQPPQPAETLAHPPKSEPVPASKSSDSICGRPSSVVDVTDDTFRAVVLDKAADVLIQFYKPIPGFCNVNGSAFDDLSQTLIGLRDTVKVARMDCGANKSPFVFEDSELPVVMLFPGGEDNAPSEYDLLHSAEKLLNFVAEHSRVTPRSAFLTIPQFKEEL